MLRFIIQVTTVVCVLVCAALAFLQATVLQLAYPQDAHESAPLFLSKSALPRDQLLSQLRDTSQRLDVEVFLISPDTTNYLNGRNVYSLGAHQPNAPVPIRWLDPSMSGQLYPGSSLAEASLNTMYAIKGPPAGRAQFKAWLSSVGVQGKWAEGGYWGGVASTAAQHLNMLTFVAGLVLMLAVILAWQASRSESRAVRLVAGASAIRIQAQDIAMLARETLIAGLTTCVVLAGAVMVAAGWSNLVTVGQLFALYAGIMIVVGILACIAISALAWPRTKRLAQRHPPVERFSLVAELLKATTLSMTLVALPGFIALASANFAVATSQASAAPLRDCVALTISGVRPDEYDTMVPQMGTFVRTIDTSGTALFATSLIRPPVLGDSDPQFPRAEAAGFGVVALVNRAYLRQVGITDDDLRGVAADDLAQAALRSQVILKQPATALGTEIRPYTLPADKTIPLPAPSDTGYYSPPRPLLLVFDHLSDSLTDDAIASFITMQHIIFTDQSLVMPAASRSGVAHIIGGVNRVADYALVTASFATRSAWTALVTLTILIVAVIVCAIVSAGIFAARDARRAFPLRAYGLAWPAVLKRRIVTETALVIGVFAVAAAGFALGGLAIPVLMVGGMAGYLALSLAIDVSASRRAFWRVATRNLH